MLLANVIFNASEAAYLSWTLLLPLAIAVVVVEAALLWAFNRDVSLKVIIACAVGMNAASYVVGHALAPMLFVDSGLVVAEADDESISIVQPGPEWPRLARHSFVQAGVISIVIEALVLLPIRRRLRLERLLAPVTLGNFISYTVLAAAFIGRFGV